MIFSHMKKQTVSIELVFSYSFVNIRFVDGYGEDGNISFRKIGKVLIDTSRIGIKEGIVQNNALDSLVAARWPPATASG
jgi:hypothetical protein